MPTWQAPRQRSRRAMPHRRGALPAQPRWTPCPARCRPPRCRRPRAGRVAGWSAQARGRPSLPARAARSPRPGLDTRPPRRRRGTRASGPDRGSRPATAAGAREPGRPRPPPERPSPGHRRGRERAAARGPARPAPTRGSAPARSCAAPACRERRCSPARRGAVPAGLPRSLRTWVAGTTLGRRHAGRRPRDPGRHAPPGPVRAGSPGSGRCSGWRAAPPARKRPGRTQPCPLCAGGSP